MPEFEIGDIIEFELAPDGENSRYNAGGRYDRGATGKWRKARVTHKKIGSDLWVPDEYTTEAENGDVYRFIIGTGATARYPLSSIRKISSKKGGAVHLIWNKEGRYYYTEPVKEDKE
jgi:hypothetical protein